LRAFATILLAAVCSLVIFSDAFAADGETAIYTASKPYVEVEVIVADSLKAYPKLYEWLAAEGRKFGEKSERDTLQQWREHKDFFRDMAHTFDRGYRLQAAAGKYVSVEIGESQFTGGAHPNHEIDTLLWDRELERRVDFKTLFTDTENNSPPMVALAKLVKDAVIAEKKAHDVPVEEDNIWFKEWKPEFEIFGEPGLAPSTEAGKSSGVTFDFSPYAVGAYVEGSYTVFIPAEKIAPYMTAEARALFGGERPKSDAEK
jgi:hypothetical protein